MTIAVKDCGVFTYDLGLLVIEYNGWKFICLNLKMTSENG